MSKRFNQSPEKEISDELQEIEEEKWEYLQNEMEMDFLFAPFTEKFCPECGDYPFDTECKICGFPHVESNKTPVREWYDGYAFEEWYFTDF